MLCLCFRGCERTIIARADPMWLPWQFRGRVLGKALDLVGDQVLTEGPALFAEWGEGPLQ